LEEKSIFAHIFDNFAFQTMDEPKSILFHREIQACVLDPCRVKIAVNFCIIELSCIIQEKLGTITAHQFAFSIFDYMWPRNVVQFGEWQHLKGNLAQL